MIKYLRVFQVPDPKKVLSFDLPWSFFLLLIRMSILTFYHRNVILKQPFVVILPAFIAN